MTLDTEKTLTLKNDYLFKAVYGSDDEDSKFILKSLLNKILNPNEENEITQIEIVNPFQPRDYLNEKESVLDIKARTGKNEIVHIEMQIVWDKYMPLRLVYYHGGLIRDSLAKGQDYKDMKPTVTICITDSIAFKDSSHYMSEFYYREVDNNFNLTDITRICCIELPKVNPDRQPLDELNSLEIILEYLRCASENSSEYVNELIHRGGKELEMAQNKLSSITQDEHLRERALAREKYQRDQISFRNRKEELEREEYQLAQDKKQLAEDQAKMAEDQAKLAEDQAKLAEDQAKLAEDQAKLYNTLRNVISGLKKNNMSVSEIANLLNIPPDEIIHLSI